MMRLIHLIVFMSVGVLFSSVTDVGAREDADCNLLPSCALEASLARREFELKDYKGSLRRYQHGFSLVRDPRLLVNIGRVLFRMGQYQQALEYYGRARSLARDPDVIPQVAGYAAEAEAALAQELPGRAPMRLLPVDPPPNAQPSRRPTWRWVVGIVSIGAGVVLGGIGASGLDQDGKSEGEQIYYTRLPGAVMLGGGITLTTVGVLVLALPIRTPRRQS